MKKSVERGLVIESEVIDETIGEVRKRAVHRLIDRVSKQGRELGRGGRAIVRVLSGKDADYCVKEIFDIYSEKSVNDIQTEFRRLQDAERIGVRVPKALLAAETEDHKAFLVMETIKGCSVEDVLMGRGELPRSYNHESFWPALKHMLERLHNEQLYHRDMHPGNIMIDESSGAPVIIDFGNATRAFGEGDPYTDMDAKPGHATQFDDDLVSWRESKIKLEKHLTEIGSSAILTNPQKIGIKKVNKSTRQ